MDRKIHFLEVMVLNPCLSGMLCAAAASDRQGFIDPMSPYIWDRHIEWAAREHLITVDECAVLRDARKGVVEAQRPDLACHCVGFYPRPATGERRCRVVEERVVRSGCTWLLRKKWPAEEWEHADWRFVHGGPAYEKHFEEEWIELRHRYSDDAEQHGVARYLDNADGTFSCSKFGLVRVPQSTIVGMFCSALMSVDEAIAELNATRPSYFS